MKNPFCKKKLSPLQRQTIRLISGCAIGLVSISMIDHLAGANGFLSKSLVPLFGFLSLIPMLGILYFLGRYLVRETDEYIRTVAVNSLLWAAAVIVVADTLQGAFAQWNSDWSLIGGNQIAIMNFDLFAVAAGFAFRIQLWRSR